MRRLVLWVVLAALIAAHPAAAQDSPIVGRSEAVGGRTLSQWAVAWDRWIFGFTRTAVNSGDCLPSPTSGPVHYLAAGGPDDAHVISADCTVPVGQYLLLTAPLLQCADVIPLPRRWRGPAGLKRCAREGWSKAADPHPRLVLDGNPIPTGAVVHPDEFRLTMPARDNLFGLPGRRHAHTALVGRPTLIKPLAPGRHTLIQGIHYRVTHNYVVVYNLTVA